MRPLADGFVATDSVPTVSSAIEKLRRILTDNRGKGNVYGRATNGSLPLVIHAENEVCFLQAT